MTAHIVIDSSEDCKGATSQPNATRQAPAQAELRPTCAGASRLASPHNITLKFSRGNWSFNGSEQGASRIFSNDANDGAYRGRLKRTIIRG
jgi:hypothetical protein